MPWGINLSGCFGRSVQRSESIPMEEIGRVETSEVRVVSEGCFDRMRKVWGGWSTATKVCVAATGTIIVIGSLVSIGVVGFVAIGGVGAGMAISTTPAQTNSTLAPTNYTAISYSTNATDYTEYEVANVTQKVMNTTNKQDIEVVYDSVKDGYSVKGIVDQEEVKATFYKWSETNKGFYNAMICQECTDSMVDSEIAHEKDADKKRINKNQIGVFALELQIGKVDRKGFINMNTKRFVHTTVKKPGGYTENKVYDFNRKITQYEFLKQAVEKFEDVKRESLN